MQKKFVCIWFPYLLTDRFSIKDPALKNIPFVLTQSSHGRMIISAMNAVAAQKGIYKGMSLADARIAAPGLQKKDDVEGLASKLLQRIAEWCIRFTPVACTDEPDGIILHATGCAHLWSGEENYVHTIQERFTEKGFSVHVCMADTPAAAWAVTKFASHIKVTGGAEQMQLIRSLPVHALRIPEDVVSTFHKLGLRTIQDVISISKNSLRRRFGKEVVERCELIFGNKEEILRSVKPPAEYSERVVAPSAVIRSEGIEIAIERLCIAICERLKKESKGLRRAELKCFRIDGKTISAYISTGLPCNNVAHLQKLFSLEIPKIEAEPGIELFVLEASDVQPHLSVQSEIIRTQGSITDPALSELTDRLAAKFGSENIYRFLPAEHYWPERAVKKTTSLSEQPQTTWRTDKPRPVILLQPPEPIQVAAPVPDYPPMHFRYQGKLHKIMHADGPERIEQEWWISNGEHRDYYAVEDENGCRYWLFRSGHYDAAKNDQWFIHGFFA